jgi:hypothetical protein
MKVSREMPSTPVTPATTREAASSTSQAAPAITQTSPASALFIAIDWADKTHDGCVLDPDTQQRTHDEVEQTPRALHAWLQDLHQHVPGQTIAIALEQKTGALINFLLEFDWIDVYPVNPVTLSRSRKALHISGAKDDPTDAHLLLDLLSRHRDTLRRLTPDTPLTRSWQRLTRQRREAGPSHPLQQSTQAAPQGVFPPVPEGQRRGALCTDGLSPAADISLLQGLETG